MNPILKIDEKDNVATCLREIPSAETVSCDGYNVKAKSDIPQYHKIALMDISVGSNVMKYGQIIGIATKDILAGEHVHVHNIESTRGRGDKKGGATV